MWGDTPGIPTGQFGHDTFVFAGDAVGTHNYIEDFQQQFDKIEFYSSIGRSRVQRPEYLYQRLWRYSHRHPA
jgi:hypothetical protein